MSFIGTGPAKNTILIAKSENNDAFPNDVHCTSLGRSKDNGYIP